MIFTMAKSISYVSQFMTLLPGDIVTTGTPPGIGTGMKPPKFLNVGDVVTLGIEGLGESPNETPIPPRLAICPQGAHCRDRAWPDRQNRIRPGHGGAGHTQRRIFTD